MLSHTDLKRGALFILNGQPCEVLDFALNFKGRGSSTAQVKIKNLQTGAALSKTFHTGDNFEEAEIEKIKIKFLYQNKDDYFFCYEKNPSQRFSLSKEQIGEQTKFLKPNQILEGFLFDEKIINIELPIKISLKVAEAPPGVRGDRSEGGTKQAILETGATVAVPLFIEAGQTIEINTETGQYTRRMEN